MTKYAQNTFTGNKCPVICGGVRTPFVKSFGIFAESSALDLYSRSVDGLLRRIPVDPKDIDEIICGAVIPQTKNMNPARDAVINLGLGDHIHGYALNRACTSSMQTIADAAKTIHYGDAHVILAGGVECLSSVPITYSDAARKFLVKLSRARSMNARINALKDFSPKDWVPRPPGLTEPLTGYTMGQHAEMMAKIHDITRESQDELALASHQNASAADLSEELIPVWSPPKYKDFIDHDNNVRSDTNMAALAKLRPAFDRKYGSITAGNASPLTDGAAVTMIADEARAKSLGLKAKAKIVDMCFVGVKPHPELLIGPAIALPLLFKRNKLKLADCDFFEIHEAFAAQVLSCLKMMKDKDFNARHLGTSEAFGEIPREKLNVNGGAIAIGHPFGATGSRLVTTLTNHLVKTQKRLGAIAICAAGGMSGAMLIERLD